MFAIGASLTKKTIDFSTMEEYVFSFHCDRCDKSWRSAPIPFDTGCSAIDNAKLRDVLWAQERRFAFNLASIEALFHFNHCPSCGRWVCDDCFRPLGSGKSDLCLDCRTKPENEAGGEETKQTEQKGIQRTYQVFMDFIARVKRLTPTETEIFRRYMAGDSNHDVSALMHISAHTLKNHNTHIYQKLGIASKDELMLYVALIRKSGLEDRLL